SSDRDWSSDVCSSDLARRHGAVSGVVAHDLIRGFQPTLSQPGSENFRWRQRVAAVAAGLRGRQVAVEMREQRARDVRLPVLVFAEGRLGEIVAAIEDAPLRMGCEL